MSNSKKLVRPLEGRKVSGVCLAFAEYFGMDVTLVRIIWALFTLFMVGLGVILYIACIFIIPQEDDGIIDGEYKENQ